MTEAAILPVNRRNFFNRTKEIHRKPRLLHIESQIDNATHGELSRAVAALHFYASFTVLILKIFLWHNPISQIKICALRR